MPGASASGVTLYREKQALSLKRKQQNDHLHFRTLREYLNWEFVNLCDRYAAERTAPLAREQQLIATLFDIKSRTPEIAGDPRVRTRIQAITTSDSERIAFLSGLLEGN